MEVLVRALGHLGFLWAFCSEHGAGARFAQGHTASRIRLEVLIIRMRIEDLDDFPPV